MKNKQNYQKEIKQVAKKIKNKKYIIDRKIKWLAWK